MFAPAILATIQELADDFKSENGQLRLVASDASDHGRALAPVPAWDLAVLYRHAKLAGRDRPRRKAARAGADARVNRPEIFINFF